MPLDRISGPDVFDLHERVEATSVSPGPADPTVASFIERARRMGDEDRKALAEARQATNESFHHRAWMAANEALGPRSGEYIRARRELGTSHVPEGLEALMERAAGDSEAIAHWNDVARLAREGMDDALLALLVRDIIRPDQLRELYRPWKAMLEREASTAQPPVDQASGRTETRPGE
jgi:hypothetical protein